MTRQFVSLGLLILVTGCVRDRVTGERRFSLVKWSPQEELQLGREQSPNIESMFEAVVPDAQANQELRQLVGEMVTHSVRKADFEFNFKILNSSVPNAFALPGGFVYITRGLLQELESEGQFISVMGHELGHVEHQHSMQNQSRGTIKGVLTAPFRLGVALTRGLPGENVVGLAAGLASAPLGLWGLKFNRAQELEADERGVFFSAEMGYDPREGVKTFQMFERLEKEAGSSWMTETSLFRTHPLNKDRVAHIEETAAKMYPQLRDKPKSEFRSGSPGFQSVLEKVKERAPVYKLYDEASVLLAKTKPTPAQVEKALAKLKEASSKLPDEPLFGIAQGEAAWVKEDKEAAKSHFAAAAALYERLIPGDSHWKPHFYLGVLALEAKQSSEAVTQLETAAKRFPMHPAVQLYLGKALEQAGDQARARAAYTKVTELVPPDSQLHQEATERLRGLR